MVSLKTTIFTHRYKFALSRRLRRFHQPGDIVYAQTMESFFIKVLKSPRSYDFLKQIELDYIVHNMKKFQEPGGGGTAIYGLYEGLNGINR